MAPPPEITVRLFNTSREGVDSLNVIPITPLSPIGRSVGSSGDPFQATIAVGAFPLDWDELGTFSISIGEPGEAVMLELAGYRLKNRQATNHGRTLGDPTGPVTPHAEVLTFETELRSIRDGRGGLLTVGQLNPLDIDGHVDTEHSDYMTNSELADLALAALGMPFEACPVAINTAADGETAIDAPGPLDWGNQRPLTELEALLSRVGWTLAIKNDGTLRCVRLARAGETITLPASISDNAEPYTLTPSPGIRSSKIVVTSGSTRTTVITQRDLDNLDWLAFDSRTGLWLAQSDFDILYPSEVGPADLDAFKAGVRASGITVGGSKGLDTVFRAVGLIGDEITEAGTFVNIPTELDYGIFEQFAGTPGIVEARGCVDMGGEQFVNVPGSDAGSPVRVEGLQALPNQAVFLLPPDLIYARMADGNIGRRSDARALTGDDLVITFAHESNTGVATDDYFIVGYELVDSGGPALDKMSDAELEAAMTDRTTIKVSAPQLRRLAERALGATEITPMNDAQLEAIAEQIVWAKVAEDALESGVITVRGLIDVQPGDADGAISRVIWDHVALQTLVFLNQHERPRSELETERRAVGDSIGLGVSYLFGTRSTASLSDVRTQMTADRAVPTSVPGDPALNAPQRGQERAQGGQVPTAGEGSHLLPTALPQRTTIYARITGDTELAGESNRWSYTWEEVRMTGYSADATDASRKSDTHGLAINTMENGNTDSGIIGPGYDTANIPTGFALQPIRTGAVVQLHGPFPTDVGNLWYFQASNVLDGECDE